jgi:hypothetical protein
MDDASDDLVTQLAMTRWRDLRFKMGMARCRSSADDDATVSRAVPEADPAHHVRLLATLSTVRLDTFRSNSALYQPFLRQVCAVVTRDHDMATLGRYLPLLARAIPPDALGELIGQIALQTVRDGFETRLESSDEALDLQEIERLNRDLLSSLKLIGSQIDKLLCTAAMLLVTNDGSDGTDTDVVALYASATRHALEVLKQCAAASMRNADRDAIGLVAPVRSTWHTRGTAYVVSSIISGGSHQRASVATTLDATFSDAPYLALLQDIAQTVDIGTAYLLASALQRLRRLRSPSAQNSQIELI